MKRSLAFMLVMVMLLCMLPTVAFAVSSKEANIGGYLTVKYKVPSSRWEQKRDVNVEVYVNYNKVATETIKEVAAWANNFKIKDIKSGLYYGNAANNHDCINASYERNTNLLSLNLFNKNPATIKIYLFTFRDGVNVDFTRYLKNIAGNWDEACDTLKISYKHDGVKYEYDYTKWDQTHTTYVPKAHNISVDPVIKDGYHVKWWITADALGDGANRLYNVDENGNTSESKPEIVLPGIGSFPNKPAQGSYATTKRMAFYFGAGGFDRFQIALFMEPNNVEQTHEHKLIYDANGGTGAPGTETSGKTTNTSYTFTVSNTKPTRENYTFLGWADTADATAAQYNAGNEITVSGTKTIYAVWEMKAPEAPDHNKISELIGTENIKVECKTDSTAHPVEGYDLKQDSYSKSPVTLNESGVFTCTVTVKPDEYVKEYNNTNGGHTLDPDTQAAGKPVTFVWDTEVESENKWVLADRSTVPVVFTVKHATSVPGSVSAVTKTRLKAVPNGVTLPNGVTINADEPVTFTDNNLDATLLYEFKVTGTAGTVVTIADQGAKFFKTNNTTEGDSIEVTIGENGAATVYGYKTFTKDNIQEGNLKNTATATNKANQDDNATGSSDVPAEYKTTEITGEVTNVEKKRILAAPNGVTLPNGVTINTDDTVTFTDNNLDATLLYAFTVTGTPGAEVVIKDTGATFIDDNGKPVNDKITVTLPNGEGDKAEITVYGYRTFNVDKINNEGKLVNTATANVESDDNNKKEAKAEVDAKDDRTLYNTLTVKKLVSGNAADQTEKFRFKATFTLPVPGASANLDGVTPVEKVEIDFELAHNQTRTFSYTSDPELKAKIDKMKESGSLSGDGDAVFAMLSYKVEETNAKGYTLATSGDAEGEAKGHNTVTFTNTKNKPNDDHGGHYHPTTTPVPVIVVPPKTGDMPFWYSIAQFLGLVK